MLTRCTDHHAMPPIANFDITVRAVPDAVGPPYSLTAAYGPRSAEGRCTQDVRDPFWQQTLAQLDELDSTLDSTLIAAAGGRLFQDVMRDAVRDLWIRARAELDADATGGLRLRLALQPPAVAGLPWELLFDAARNAVLAADVRTPVVRRETQFHHVGVTRSLRTQPPIRILLAIPDDPSGQIDTARAAQQMTELVSCIGPPRAHLTFCRGRCDVLTLRQAMDAAQPDILHIVAHGAPAGLLLWQQDQPAWVSPPALRTIVQQTPSIKLVLLNACWSGHSAEHQAFSTFGPQLLQAGVPAVIAMQFAVADRMASDFSADLYTELLAGPRPGQIDRAVSHARSNLYVRNPASPEFATPVLWLNSADGVIFEPDAPPAARSSTAPVPTDGAPAAAVVTARAPLSASPNATDIDALRQQVDAIEAWLNAAESHWVDAAHAATGADLRTLLGIRTRELRNLRSLLTQLHHLEETGQNATTADVLPLYRNKVNEIQQKHATLLHLDKQLQDHNAAE